MNSGINRIEIIDTSKNSIIGNLKTSLSNPQKTKPLKDNDILLATSKDNTGRGALDLIDINNKKIINTLKFMEKDSSPYDIVAIQKDSYNNDDILSSNKSNIDNNSGEVILANKVLSTYKEKIIFQQEKIELSNAAKINIEEIRFENCKVIEESKNKEYISNKEDYIILYFDFIIPYYIKCIDSNKEILNIKGYNEKFPFGTVFKYNSIGKWLSGIKNSDFVITDSYHGVLFSLLYNKEFICIGNASASYSRFKSIIENISYDISRRMFYSIDEITDLSKLDKLNYEKINKRIWKLRINAIYWLKNAFNTEKNITNECFDALVKVDKFSGELITKEQEVRELSGELITKEQKVSELSIRINELSNSILNLSSKNNELSDRLNDITSEYEKMKKMYDDTNVELNEVIKQNSELNDKINRIINSKSWKVTAPIRNFNTRIRGKK